MAPAVIEVVGSLNMDLVTITPRVPGPGETLAATSFSTYFGGKGANQAVACARLSRGSEQAVLVSMHGAVGDDQFGTDLLEHLKREQIDVSSVSVKAGEKTGTAVILVEETSGENRILVTAGSNFSLFPADVKYSGSDSNFRLVIFQLETPLETVLELIKRARREGFQVLLNPAPAAVIPENIYAHIDHLILNETEAAILSGTTEERLAESIAEIAESFCSKGVRNVVITLGAKGVFSQTYTNIKSRKQGHYIEGRKVKVVDTTAAGDTFVGAYASFLARHGSENVKEAVEFANIAASMTVQKPGAQASIPFLNELPS